MEPTADIETTNNEPESKAGMPALVLTTWIKEEADCSQRFLYQDSDRVHSKGRSKCQYLDFISSHYNL